MKNSFIKQVRNQPFQQDRRTYVDPTFEGYKGSTQSRIGATFDKEIRTNLLSSYLATQAHKSTQRKPLALKAYLDSNQEQKAEFQAEAKQRGIPIDDETKDLANNQEYGKLVDEWATKTQVDPNSVNEDDLERSAIRSEQMALKELQKSEDIAYARYGNGAIANVASKIAGAHGDPFIALITAAGFLTGGAGAMAKFAELGLSAVRARKTLKAFKAAQDIAKPGYAGALSGVDIIAKTHGFGEFALFGTLTAADITSDYIQNRRLGMSEKEAFNQSGLALEGGLTIAFSIARTYWSRRIDLKRLNKGVTINATAKDVASLMANEARKSGKRFGYVAPLFRAVSESGTIEATNKSWDDLTKARMADEIAETDKWMSNKVNLYGPANKALAAEFRDAFIDSREALGLDRELAAQQFDELFQYNADTGISKQALLKTNNERAIVAANNPDILLLEPRLVDEALLPIAQVGERVAGIKPGQVARQTEEGTAVVEDISFAPEGGKFSFAGVTNRILRGTKLSKGTQAIFRQAIEESNTIDELAIKLLSQPASVVSGKDLDKLAANFPVFAGLSKIKNRKAAMKAIQDLGDAPLQQKLDALSATSNPEQLVASAKQLLDEGAENDEHALNLASAFEGKNLSDKDREITIALTQIPESKVINENNPRSTRDIGEMANIAKQSKNMDEAVRKLTGTEDFIDDTGIIINGKYLDGKPAKSKEGLTKIELENEIVTLYSGSKVAAKVFVGNTASVTQISDDVFEYTIDGIKAKGSINDVMGDFSEAYFKIAVPTARKQADEIVSKFKEKLKVTDDGPDRFGIVGENGRRLAKNQSAAQLALKLNQQTATKLQDEAPERVAACLSKAIGGTL